MEAQKAACAACEAERALLLAGKRELEEELHSLKAFRHAGAAWALLSPSRSALLYTLRRCPHTACAQPPRPLCATLRLLDPIRLCSHCQGAELQRRNQNLTAALAEAEQRIEQLRAASAASNADELQRELRKREKRLQLATSEVCARPPLPSGTTTLD